MYSTEKQIQILIALLKAHGVTKVIASPGTTNASLVRSLQGDSDFEMYSCVDERGAAYMACGMAAESGNPVMLSCTGATASRNYLPGLTEAFYRGLPVLAVTSTQDVSRVGHNVAQVLDNSVLPVDIVRHSVHIQSVKDATDEWDCEIKLNKALLELTRRGGGPVHVNLTMTYNMKLRAKKLPKVRAIRRFDSIDSLPELPAQARIGVLVGSHAPMSAELTEAIDSFCEAHNAVVFQTKTSGYRGACGVQHSLASFQRRGSKELSADLIIYIGGCTEDYYTQKLMRGDLWRVSPDGEIRDPYRNLKNVFEMRESAFFKAYASEKLPTPNGSYLQACRNRISVLNSRVPELPFSNMWVARRSAPLIPPHSVMHYGILSSLRCWNLVRLSPSISTTSNVGGFGIDGCVSSLIGASWVNKDKLYFGVVGDLAFFYDLNSLGNRQIGNNIRILLVNNGAGGEFLLRGNPTFEYRGAIAPFIAARGHFGDQSKHLVRNYSECLGFRYLSATCKEEFDSVCEEFFDAKFSDKPLLLEVFTDDKAEDAALQSMANLHRE